MKSLMRNLRWLFIVLLFAISVFVDTQATVDSQNRDVAKAVYSLYHGPYLTREFNGGWGIWKRSGTAQQSKAEKTYFNYNPDLLDANDRHQIASVLYPINGPQSDTDPDYLEYQVLQAKTGHIDGFIVDWPFPEFRTNDTVNAFMAVAKKYDFKIGIDYVHNWLFSFIKYYRPACDTHEKQVDAFRDSLQYLLTNVYSADTALLVNGHPLIVLFGSGKGASPEEFREILSRPFDLSAGMKPPLFIRGMGIGAMTFKPIRADYEKWGGLVDGCFAWVPARPRGLNEPPLYLKTHDMYAISSDTVKYQKYVYEMNNEYYQKGLFSVRSNSATPGMDNRPSYGWGQSLKYIDWEDGDTYRKQWEFNVKHRDNIDIVFVNTWNDFTEATVVMPSVQNGYREMETTEKYAAKFKGIESGSEGIRLPAKLFKLRKRAGFLSQMGIQVENLSALLDQAALSISQADYQKSDSLLSQANDIVLAKMKRIKSENVSVSFPGQEITAVTSPEEHEGIYKLRAGKQLSLRFDETLSFRLREHNFIGFLEFEYYDADQREFTILTDSSKSDTKKSRYSELCRIKKDKTGSWVKARVKIHKANTAFLHRAENNSDFVFNPDVEIRNIFFEFEIFDLTMHSE